jgi:hypothetical protein
MPTFVLALALVALQDPAPPQVPPTPANPPATAPSATTPAPKPELVRGVLPEAASPEAKALFAKLAAATRVDPNAPAPTGFDLTFEGTVHQAQKQSNDFPKTRYRFDPRGWVRLSVISSGRERMSGPKGMFLVDGQELVALSGREHDEDRRQIREELSIAQNFLALADPRNLRVAKLEKLAAAPSALPANLASAATKLEWLALESPDFRLFQSPKTDANQNWRVELGLDAATHLPKLVSVTELAAADGQPESAMLVDFRAYQTLDGLQIPAQLATYGVDAAALPWKYSRWTALELGLCAGGTLRPKFAESDFTPPPKPAK